MRALDELQETVARYDEKIDEADDRTRHGGGGRGPAAPPAPTGPGFDRLKASLASHREGLQPVRGAHVPRERGLAVRHRAAMFIVKGPRAIGWYARGFEGAADA